METSDFQWVEHRDTCGGVLHQERSSGRYCSIRDDEGRWDRLTFNLTIQHPVTPFEFIANGSDDSKAKFLRDKLLDALRWLEPALLLTAAHKPKRGSAGMMCMTRITLAR